MTVRTKDDAFLDLYKDGFPLPDSIEKRRHVVSFVAEVMKLKNSNVGIATINARMSGEVLHKTNLIFDAIREVRNENPGLVLRVVPTTDCVMAGLADGLQTVPGGGPS